MKKADEIEPPDTESPKPSILARRLSQDEVFDDDYLYFNEMYLTRERTRLERELIVKICSPGANATFLDVGCGHGRISNELALGGFKVTGVDMSESAILRARRNAETLSVDVNYIVSDFLSFETRTRYDFVLSWYTSFGYFDDDTNKQILNRMFLKTKPGGACLIEHINRDRMLKNFTEQMFQRRNEDVMLDQIKFDVISSRSTRERTFYRAGKLRSVTYDIRIFTFTELAGWLRSAGFSQIFGYGSEGERFTVDSKRMLILATREK
ncbi:class I SAM-dependent methyltransferase [Paraburkholderia solisilvae]|uniref:Ubiquinone biosynthesis O-methyltransferase, mitochondrial n=1 Tax=Paraburkholderia solisilvae TaxID=624376 RepID=A0A6J5ED20_9BURK|nr:class I SAM-dependent methyltransferase [Paraburkholderia solisilvae]CAB3764379.1 Ubiquinone biosynthesis O-methyltransferase, mitochondrial [Paraburkholderia solisilvae]